MKSIHAISTILADWRIESSVQVPSLPSRPAQTAGLHAKDRHKDGTNTLLDPLNSKQPCVGIPTLLADALLQGGSSTERRRK
jgi:hypothetical protein